MVLETFSKFHLASRPSNVSYDKHKKTIMPAWHRYKELKFEELDSRNPKRPRIDHTVETPIDEASTCHSHPVGASSIQQLTEGPSNLATSLDVTCTAKAESDSPSNNGVCGDLDPLNDQQTSIESNITTSH